MPVEIGGVTYLRMADSIYPQNLPVGMDAYAGYDNGRWADFPAIAAAHPGAHLLDFSVFLTDLGTGGDDETGDMTDAQMVGWLRERLAAGVWRPVGYKSVSGIPALAAAWAAAGIPRRKYRLLAAHYGAGQHICGPATCGCPVQCDGAQWIDHGGWDESLLAVDFFAPAEPHATAPIPPASEPISTSPPPAVPSVSTDGGEVNMPRVFQHAVGAGGYLILWPDGTYTPIVDGPSGTAFVSVNGYGPPAEGVLSAGQVAALEPKVATARIA